MSPTGIRLQKLRVFLLVEIRRDMESRVGFFVKYLWIFLLCFIYGFFFRSALWQKNIVLDGYWIELPLFLVSGLAAARIIPLSIRIVDETFSELRNARLIEWVLTTPTGFWELFAARTIWNSARALTELMALIVFAHILIGIPIRPFFQGSLLLAAVLMFTAYASLGMILSSISLFLKKGNILFNFLFQISAAFGGVFFPTHLFEGRFAFLTWVSHSLPITHALGVIRLSLIHEKTPDAAAQAQILAALTLIFLTVGLVLLQRSLVWAKKNGKF